LGAAGPGSVDGPEMVHDGRPALKRPRAAQDHLVVHGRFGAEERDAAFISSVAKTDERRGHGGPPSACPRCAAEREMFSAIARTGGPHLHGARRGSYTKSG
jgi:hypothetical protein